MKWGVKFPIPSPKSAESIESLKKIGIKYKTQKDAVKAYLKVLKESVSKEAEGLKRAGLLLSGGVDSVLLGFLLKDKLKLNLYTAGVKNSNDIKNAKFAAKKLGLPLHAKEITLKDVKEKLKVVMKIIRTSGAMQVGAGIVDYFVQTTAKENGEDILFYGQDPDLPFGGVGEHFPQYNQVCKGKNFHKNYWELTFKGMQADFEQKFDLARADRLGKHIKIQYRIPYEHFDIFKVAREIDARLFYDNETGLWKMTQRKAALNVDVPEDIALRSKEHIQSGTGIFDIFKLLALKNVNKICVDKGSNYLFGVDKVNPMIKYFLRVYDEN